MLIASSSCSTKHGADESYARPVSSGNSIDEDTQWLHRITARVSHTNLPANLPSGILHEGSAPCYVVEKIIILLAVLVVLAACGQGGATGGTEPTAASGSQPTAASVPEAQASPVALSADTSLAAIKQRGKLIVGVKYDLPTFGFLDPETNKVDGFDIELAKLVALKIFGNPDAVEFKEAISKNRIPYLEQDAR